MVVALVVSKIIGAVAPTVLGTINKKLINKQKNKALASLVLFSKIEKSKHHMYPNL
jgi:hypothetical protein